MFFLSFFLFFFFFPAEVEAATPFLPLLFLPVPFFVFFKGATLFSFILLKRGGQGWVQRQLSKRGEVLVFILSRHKRSKRKQEKNIFSDSGDQAVQVRPH